MSSEIAKRDQNFVPVLLGVTDDASQDIKMLRVDPNSGRLLVTGTVTAATIADAVGTVNGVNTTFTVSATPTLIYCDGGTYFDTYGYTISGLTVTMNFAPVSYVKYQY